MWIFPMEYLYSIIVPEYVQRLKDIAVEKPAEAQSSPAS